MGKKALAKRDAPGKVIEFVPLTVSNRTVFVPATEARKWQDAIATLADAIAEHPIGAACTMAALIGFAAAVNQAEMNQLKQQEQRARAILKRASAMLKNFSRQARKHPARPVRSRCR